MSEYKKPLPIATAWSRPFWEGCRRHELLLQKCSACGRVIFYPKLFCPFCLSKQLEWFPSGGRGKIYSYTIVHSYQPTEFSADVPYVVAVIELAEGVRLMSNIVGCPPQAVRCDMEVEAVFDDVTPGCTLPKFRPLSAEQGSGRK